MIKIINKPVKRKLKDNLNYLNVDTLKILAKCYEVQSTYKMKKKELIDILYERMTNPDYFMPNIAAYYEFKVFEDEFLFRGKESLSEEEKQTITAFNLSNIGMYFIYEDDEGGNAIVPEEIVSVIEKIDDKEIEKMLASYQLVFDYLRAFKNFYGIFEMDFFIKVFSRHNNIQLDKEHLKQYIEKHNIFNTKIYIKGNSCICESLYYDEGYLEIMSGRSQKEYCILEKEEMLKYKDEYYIKKTVNYNKLYKYLQRIIKDKYILEDIMSETYADCKMDIFDIQYFISMLERFGVQIKSMNMINDLMKLLMDFNNNTPKWINKGWTPKELKGEEMQDMNPVTKVKIGRNEPCPCGSGKKYKKCCMKLN